MGKSPYLGNYDLSNDKETFTITFEIPDNCSYTANEEMAGNYTIAVTLNPDEKEPSDIFVEKSEVVTCDQNDDLDVGFLLPTEGGLGLAKKPKILVNALLG